VVFPEHHQSIHITWEFLFSIYLPLPLILGTSYLRSKIKLINNYLFTLLLWPSMAWHLFPTKEMWTNFFRYNWWVKWSFDHVISWITHFFLV
jgi:hypothetical protein